MVLNFPGFRICYKGERYIIGEKIVVDGGPYDGIYGVLAEIRSDEDSELGIGNADFYFKLFAPLYEEDIRAFEQRYSGWCNEPKKLENIPMEKVRISIDGVKFLREDIVAHKVATFFVQEKWVIDGERGTDIQVFLDRNLAEYYYLEQIYRGKEEGFIKKWQKEPGFYEEVGLNTYKCGDKWSRSANYYEVELCDDEIEIGDEALECIGQQYIGAKLRKTLDQLFGVRHVPVEERPKARTQIYVDKNRSEVYGWGRYIDILKQMSGPVAKGGLDIPDRPQVLDLRDSFLRIQSRVAARSGGSNNG